MIDTDKYEGHPPAPWGWRHKVSEYRLTANGDKDWIDIQVDEDTDPTVMTLIADAPLLLAEVKRLQTIIHEIEHHNGVSAEVITASSDAEFVNGLLAEVKRLREENDVLAEAVKKDNEILKKHIETLAEVKQMREAIADIADDMVENLPNNLRVYVSKLRKVIE